MNETLGLKFTNRCTLRFLLEGRCTLLLVFYLPFIIIVFGFKFRTCNYSQQLVLVELLNVERRIPKATEAVAAPGGGSGGSGPPPPPPPPPHTHTPSIRHDAFLRLKFLHRQDRISLSIWPFFLFFNETRVTFRH